MTRMGCVAMLALCAPLGARAQSAFTNNFTANAGVTDVWGVAVNWTNESGTAGVPGHDGSGTTGTSNDVAVVNFGATATGTFAPTLDLAGSNYVLRTLQLTESATANVNADGNIVSSTGLATLTLENVFYTSGGRQLDFLNVAIADKVDGKALYITNNATTLDFAGGVIGTEGLRVDGNQTMFFRNYQMTYGADATNGLWFGGTGGGSRRFGIDASITNVTHDIPNLTIDIGVAQNLTFLNMSPSNLVTVNVSNLVLNPALADFRIGGESRADGAPAATVNVNGQVSFANVTNSINRSINIQSAFGGIVNFNSNIVINQNMDVGRTNFFGGNGVLNIHANTIHTNGDLFTGIVQIDGDRGLAVSVDTPDTLGAGVLRPAAGSILRMNYDVYGSFSNGFGGYPGSNFVYASNEATFLDFGGPQSGFFDPRFNVASSALVVRAFNGIAGNLGGAVFTNGPGQNIVIQTNAVIAENALNQPTLAQIGQTVWMGITNAGGTYTGVGDTNTIFRGVALSALMLPGGDNEVFSSGVNPNGFDATLSGFHGKLTAFGSNDLEVLVDQQSGVNIGIMPQSSTNRAEFNSATGVANFRGIGSLLFQSRNDGSSPLNNIWDTWSGSVTNLVRIGLDGTPSPENPLAFQQQNSLIVDLNGENTFPSNKTLTVMNGQVRVRSGSALGAITGATNTTLVIGAGGSLLPDDGNNGNIGTITLNRGTVIFQDDGAVYTGTQPDSLDFGATIRSGMVFSASAMLVLNDAASNDNVANRTPGLRRVNTSGYSYLISNMNVVLGDDAMRTAVVQTASSFALNNDRRLTTPGNEDGNLDMIISGANSNVNITAAAGATQIFFTGASGRSLNIRAGVVLTNAAENLTLIVNNTNRFFTVVADGTQRTNAFQAGTVNLLGLTNLLTDVRLFVGTNNIGGNFASGRDISVTNGGMNLFALQAAFRDLNLEGGLTLVSNRVLSASFSNITSAGTLNVFGLTNTINDLRTTAGTATLRGNQITGNDISITNSTLNIFSSNGVVVFRDVSVERGATLTNFANSGSFRDVVSSGTASFAGTNFSFGNVESRGISNTSATVRFFAASTTVSNVLSTGGGDIAFGNDAIDTIRILGDLTMRDSTNDGPTISMSQGDVRILGNVNIENTSNTNGPIGGAAFNPTLNMLAATNIVAGSVYIGPTNGIAGTGILRVGDNNQDVTIIGGDLVLNTAAANTESTVIQRGDLVVSNNIIVNAYGFDRRTVTNAFVRTASGNATFLWLQAMNDTNIGDAFGLYDRLRDGNLALGSDGILVKPFGQILFDYNRTNFPGAAGTNFVGQKITVDTGGPAYNDDLRTFWLRAQTNQFQGTAGVSNITTLYLTNVWMNENAHLRVDKDNGIGDARLGLVLAGTNSYLSESSSTSNDPFDLQDVQSSAAGIARTLWIGTTNGVADIPFTNTLWGTVSEDVTLSVFNGRLMMTNGATILGTAQVARDGSIFEILPGTTGYVGQVSMLAGVFSNRGDAITFSNIAVAGGQAILDGQQSYATNLNLFGGTAVVQSAALGLGQVNFDGGALRGVTNYVLASDQGVRVTNIANGGTGIVIVDAGVTMAISNAVDGDGTLAKAGLGTLILSNANLQAGTSVRQGTLLYSGNNRLRTDGGGTLTVEGGVLDLNGFNQDSAGTVTFKGGLTTNGTITKTGADFDAQAGEVAATLQGTAGLTQTGPGTTTLSGSNAYQGATTIAGGALRLNNANALPGGIAATGGTSALILTNGGVLGLGFGNFTRNLGTDVSNVAWTGSGGFAAYGAERHVNLGGNDSTQTLTWGQANFVSGDNELVFGASDADATVIWDNSILLTGTNRFRANAGPATFDGAIAGDIGETNAGIGYFVKTGDGTLELRGSNTWSGGTEVSGGVLMFANANALPSASLLTISNFGAIGLGAGDFTRSLGTNGGDVVWTGSGGFAAGGVNRFVNIGGATQQLVWGSTFFVPEGVDGSVLVLGGSTEATIDFQNHIDLGASNRTVLVNGIDPKGAILSGVLSGSGGLIKAGEGALVLNNTNLFTGDVQIQQGRLILDGTNILQVVSAVLGSTNDTSGILVLGDVPTVQTLSGLTVTGTGINNRVVGGAADVSTLTLDIAAGVTNEYTGFLGGPGANENNLALVKTNDGTLFLSAINSYTGLTTVAGGTLAIGADGALGGDPGSYIADQLTLNGGILRATNSFALIANRGITLGALGGTFDVDATRRVTNNAVVTGAGGLTKVGNGTLILRSNSTYSGVTVVAGGVLRLDATNAIPGGIQAIGGTSALTLTNGGVLGLATNNFNRNLGATVSNVQWTGSGGFAAYLRDRTVNLGGAGAGVAWGVGGFVPDGSALILGASDSTNTITFANPINLGATNLLRTVQIENGSLTTDAIMTGSMSGEAGILKTGPGLVQLVGLNTYTGRTVVAAGTLLITNEFNLGTAPASYVFDQLTLDGGGLYPNANATIDDPNRGIWLGPSNATVTGGAFTLTVNNSIGGPGSLTLVSSTLRLNAANTYTGRTVLTSGTLYISNENALGTPPDSYITNQLTFNGGTLRVTNAAVIDDANRGINNQGASTYNIDAASSLTVSNQILGTGSLTKSGLGLLALYTSNAYTGATAIRGGTLALAGEEALGIAPGAFTAAQLRLTNGGALRATESFVINDATRGLTLDAGGGGGGTFNVDAGVTLNISNLISGNGSLLKIGAGTLLLNSNANLYGSTNAFGPGTVIAGGTVGVRVEQGLSTNRFFAVDNLTLSNGGFLRALASFSIDDTNRGVFLGAGGGGFEADPGITLTIQNNILGGNSLSKRGSGTVNIYGASNVLDSVFSAGGALQFGNDITDRTLIASHVIANDVATNATIVSFNNGLNEVLGSISFNPTSNTNLVSGGALSPTLNLLAETTIVYGSVFIGATNAGTGSGHLVVGNAATDYTEIRGDLILDAPASSSSTRQIFSRGDAVVFSNVIVNASGVNPLGILGARGEAANFFIEGDFDTNYTDGFGLGDRSINGTLVQGPDGIVIMPYGSMRLDLNRTNTLYTIGQRITIDNAGGGPSYGFGDRVLEFVTDTNLLVGTLATPAHTGVFDVTNVVMRDGSYMRVNESASEVRLGLTLEGTNAGSTVYLGDSTSGSAEPFDLLFVRASVGGQSHTVEIGTTNSPINDDLGLVSTLLGTATADINFHVLSGSLIVTNGQGNILGSARAAGAVNNGAEIALVAPSNSGLAGISGIAGSYEVGDYGRLRVVLPRTNALFVVSQAIRITNNGAAYFGNGYSAPIAIDRNDGEPVGTTIFAFTNVTMGANSYLRVQKTIDDGGMTAVLGLSLEGNTFMSQGNTHESDNFDLFDVRSSVPGEARTLQVGVNGLGETRLETALYGAASPDITFDILNGKLTVSSNIVVGDVQGSVIVHQGSQFQIGDDGLGIEGLMSLSGNGTVIGSVIVSNIFSPGLSAGTLTVTGDVSFVSASILNFELSGLSTNAGGGINDLLQLVGSGSDLALDGLLNVFELAPFTNMGWAVGDYWTLATYSGGLLSSNLATGTLPALDPGLAWTIDSSFANEIRLSIVVPEPTTWVLVLLGLAFGSLNWLARRRRP